ncbi:MAG: hypothetical protein ACRCZK_05275, partial [Oscillospiraceae bacterium]
MINIKKFTFFVGLIFLIFSIYLSISILKGKNADEPVDVFNSYFYKETDQKVYKARKLDMNYLNVNDEILVKYYNGEHDTYYISNGRLVSLSKSASHTLFNVYIDRGRGQTSIFSDDIYGPIIEIGIIEQFFYIFAYNNLNAIILLTLALFILNIWLFFNIYIVDREKKIDVFIKKNNNENIQKNIIKKRTYKYNVVDSKAYVKNNVDIPYNIKEKINFKNLGLLFKGIKHNMKANIKNKIDENISIKNKKTKKEVIYMDNKIDKNKVDDEFMDLCQDLQMLETVEQKDDKAHNNEKNVGFNKKTKQNINKLKDVKFYDKIEITSNYVAEDPDTTDFYEGRDKVIDETDNIYTEYEVDKKEKLLVLDNRKNREDKNIEDISKVFSKNLLDNKKDKSKKGVLLFLDNIMKNKSKDSGDDVLENDDILENKYDDLNLSIEDFEVVDNFEELPKEALDTKVIAEVEDVFEDNDIEDDVEIEDIFEGDAVAEDVEEHEDLLAEIEVNIDEAVINNEKPAKIENDAEDTED